jgi:hypothetical protein
MTFELEPAPGIIDLPPSVVVIHLSGAPLSDSFDFSEVVVLVNEDGDTLVNQAGDRLVATKVSSVRATVFDLGG